MSDVIQLDRTMTVNEIAARYPRAIPVFNRCGMDTCCGGGVAVEEAARRDGLAVEDVLAALRAAIEDA